MSNEEQKFRIVVGLDFSSAGHLALDHGFRSTRASGTPELHVVHCVTRDDLSVADGIRKIEKEEDALHHLPRKVWDRIDYVAHRMGLDLAPIRVFAHVRLGSPAEALLQVAIDFDADLIIVGTHDRSGLHRLIDGSVAQEVARKAHCAVMLARPKDYDGTFKTQQIEPSRADLKVPEAGRSTHVYSGEKTRSWASGSPSGVRML